MRKLGSVAAVTVILFLTAGGALAGGPPIVNETVHHVSETLTDIGFNCATGNLSQRVLTFSGVTRTLVRADGSYAVRGTFRGDTVMDDLPADGIPDATAHFRFAIGEMVVPSGNTVISEVGNGTATLLATGAELRFHVAAKVVLGPAGRVKLEIFRLTCD